MSVHVEDGVAAPTAAHVHFGSPWVSGRIIFPFGDATSPIDETFALTLTDVNNLPAGNLYVNVHSGAFPSGEMRGQRADLNCCTLRGNFNDNGQIQVSDLILLIAYVFRAGASRTAC